VDLGSPAAERPDQRVGRPDRDRDVPTSLEVEEGKGVVGSTLSIDVASDGADPDQVDVGGAQQADEAATKRLTGWS
jgi:hypothetical protein